MDEQDLQRTKTKLEEEVLNLQQETITLDNFRKYFERLESNERLIKSNIEHIVRERKEIRTLIGQETQKSNYQEYVNRGIISMEIYNLQRRDKKLMITAYNWMTIFNDMTMTILKKCFELLDDANLAVIRKESLTLARESDEKRNTMYLEQTKQTIDMAKEFVNNKAHIMEQRYFTLQEGLLQTIRVLVAKSNGISDAELKGIMKDFKEQTSKTPAPIPVAQAVAKPVAPPIVTASQVLAKPDATNQEVLDAVQSDIDQKFEKFDDED